jgi:hypothetical protein
VLDKPIHRTAVEGQLLGLVCVVLITGHLLPRSAQPCRLCPVGIARQQLWSQTVDRGGVRFGREWLAIDVGGAGIGSEIVVEGHVLVKDDHQMMDRCSGRRFRARGRGLVRTGVDKTEDRDRNHGDETLHSHAAEAYRL